jgi:hypothetical protein
MPVEERQETMEKRERRYQPEREGRWGVQAGVCIARLEMGEPTSRAQVASPIEPLLIRLLKGHIDDADLSAKIARLYEARGKRDIPAAACDGEAGRRSRLCHST